MSYIIEKKTKLILILCAVIFFVLGHYIAKDVVLDCERYEQRCE